LTRPTSTCIVSTKLSGYELNHHSAPQAKANVVRANAQYMDKAVEDPKPYQDFFVSLEKSMFLTAHQVD
jgi:hypothetical protein